MEKTEMTRRILQAKKSKGLSWAAIAGEVSMSPVWTASTALGENSATESIAHKLCAVLDLSDEVAEALQECPMKGNSVDGQVPTDPLIYRFYEIMAVYGTSIKEIIHEEFGDGIMSAIDFSLDIAREENPKGDRVKVVMSGKFLPYARW